MIGFSENSFGKLLMGCLAYWKEHRFPNLRPWDEPELATYHSGHLNELLGLVVAI